MFKSRESKNCPSLVTKSDVLELKFDCSNAQKTVCSNKSMFIALQGWWRFPYSSSGHRWLPVRTSFYDDPNLTSHFIHYDQTEVRTAGQEATPIFYVEVNAELNWTKVEDWTTSWVLGLIPAALGWDAVIKLYEHPHSHPHPTELPLKDEQHKITEIFKVPLQASCEILYI